MAILGTLNTKVTSNYSSLKFKKQNKAKKPNQNKKTDSWNLSAKEGEAEGLVWEAGGKRRCSACRLSLCSVYIQFKCCGSNNYTDWADSLWIKSPESNGRKVPDSCCKTITDLCGRRDHPSNIYKEVKAKGLQSQLSQSM